MNGIQWDSVEDVEITSLNNLDAVFIAGSRTISAKRILELAKKYIVRGNVIWGYLQNEYIEGFEGQQQFKTLEFEKLETVLKQFEKLKLPHSFTILKYAQSDLGQVLEAVNFRKALFINASWKIAFHRRPEFLILEKKRTEFKLISPFTSEAEAIAYASKISTDFVDHLAPTNRQSFTDKDCMLMAHEASRLSFDYTWQTGSVLVKDGQILLTGHNRIVPYETYMWHTGSLKEHGISKEKDLSQMHNLNTNDTLHAEMDILTQALNQQLDLTDTTLYVSLMPCPNCARAIASTKIKRVVYEHEHFGGLAETILSKAGKEIEQIK
jgi:dCMP deaminase